MKKFFLIMSFCAVSSFAFFSCGEEEEPTPAKGKVTFWNLKESQLGNVIVTMADATTGVITTDYASAPSCDNATGCFVYEADPGTYSFKAAEEDGDGDGLPDRTWEGSITITSGGCLTMKLTNVN